MSNNKQLEESKVLRCKYCGKPLPGPYVKALDGNISHPACYDSAHYPIENVAKLTDIELKAKLYTMFAKKGNTQEGIEKALHKAGFHIWAHHRDEYLWGIHRKQNRPQTIYLWLDWINGEYHILERTEKGDIK